VDHAHDVDLVQASPVGRLDLPAQATHDHAGVVDQHVERAAIGVHRIGQPLHGRLVDEIGGVHPGLRAECCAAGAHRIQPGDIAGDQEQPRAFGREGQRQRFADAAAGAGDQHAAAAEVADRRGFQGGAPVAGRYQIGEAQARSVTVLKVLRPRKFPGPP
jgi:hypothetical protein